MCCKQFITDIIVVAAEGLWHFGSLFYHNTQYSQRGCFTNVLWCDIPLNKTPQTGPHHIWCIYTPCPFFGPTSTHSSKFWVDDFTGHCLLWPSSSKTFSGPTLGLTTSLGLGRSWLFSASSINFLTRSSLKSLSLYLASHKDNNIQLFSTARSRGWKQFNGPPFAGLTKG